MVGRVIPINKCTWCMYNVGLHVKCVALPIVVGAWSMVVLSSWHGMMVSSNCRSVIPMLCTYEGWISPVEGGTVHAPYSFCVGSHYVISIVVRGHWYLSSCGNLKDMAVPPTSRIYP